MISLDTIDCIILIVFPPNFATIDLEKLMEEVLNVLLELGLHLMTFLQESSALLNIFGRDPALLFSPDTGVFVGVVIILKPVFSQIVPLRSFLWLLQCLALSPLSKKFPLIVQRYADLVNWLL